MSTPPVSSLFSNSLANRLAKRLNGVSESATLKLNAAVQALRAQGHDVINLTTGEPDFQPPAQAQEAVLEAVRLGKSKYTPAAGVPELRGLVAEKTNRQQPSVVAASGAWKASDVIVTNGGKQALSQTMFALLDEGDHVLIPSPYWLSYPEMAKLAGGMPVFVPTRFEEGFKLQPETLRQVLNASGKRARLLLLNSPSNPTGATLTRAEQRALGEVIREAIEGPCPDLWVVSDEIYDAIVFGNEPFCSFAEASPFLRDRIVTVNGLSKSAAMTGWRLGWAVAPAPVRAAIETLQGQTTSGVNALTQAAACAALKLPQAAYAEWIATYRRRRDLALGILAQATRLEVLRPEGAFYLFIRVDAIRRAGEDTAALAERILSEAGVAVMPGAPFGAPDWVRITFATDERSLQAGCERLVRFASN
jgi:aspartate aminotransferase